MVTEYVIVGGVKLALRDNVDGTRAFPVYQKDGTALPATLIYGRTVVTAAGTEVTLGAAATLTRGLWVKALSTNTGTVYVGLNGVSSTTGYELLAGQSVFLEVADRATVFIDSSVNGEGVSYVGS